MLLKLNILLLAILIIYFSQSVISDNCPTVIGKPIIICYWASWAIYRLGDGNHKLEKIEPEFCTHLVYSFAGLNINGGIDSLDYHNDINTGGYKKFNELKETHPCLKTILAVGGWGEGSEKYSLMAETEQGRIDFANAVLRFIVQFGFDGLDLDWEYPTTRGGIREDKENYGLLLEVLHEKLSHRNKLLTAAIPASINVINQAYNVTQLCQYLDYVNVMGYDMHEQSRTSVHSPLKREFNEPINRDTIDIVVQHLLRNGCFKDKIVLGIPTFGRTYTLRSASNNGVGAAINGPGKPGNFTVSEGFLAYYEICTAIAKDSWKVTYLKQNCVKYATKGDQWVSYDDVETVTQKADYVKRSGLAGVMFWSIDTDDFKGDCNRVSYPLLEATHRLFGY